jgi:uncharacterized membrane protein HdeD (DUF308 family)
VSAKKVETGFSKIPTRQSKQPDRQAVQFNRLMIWAARPVDRAGSPGATTMMTKLGVHFDGTGTSQDIHRMGMIGAVFAVIGVVAIVLPLPGMLAAESLVAAMFVLWGAAGFWFVWEMRFAPEWRYGGVVFALMFLAGLIFDVFPVAGIEMLIILMMLSLLMEGIVFILFGLRSSARLASWGWLIFGGTCSLIVGLVIMIGWTSTASWAIGLLMGVNFLSNGLALAMFGRAIDTTI